LKIGISRDLFVKVFNVKFVYKIGEVDRQKTVKYFGPYQRQIDTDEEMNGRADRPSDITTTCGSTVYF
jgi:hypothetical protein